MKKLNVQLISFILAIFSIALISCDDEESTKENSYSFDGVKYKIATGFLENYGSTAVKNVASYNLDLTFFTSGITYNTINGEITGTGSYLYFEMFSTSGSQLTPGTYSFDLYETLNSGTFDYAEAGINFNFSTETGSTFVDIVAGTVVVKLSNTTYEITIDLTSTDNKKLTGYYKGTLTYVDLSEVAAKDVSGKILKK